MKGEPTVAGFGWKRLFKWLGLGLFVAIVFFFTIGLYYAHLRFVSKETAASIRAMRIQVRDVDGSFLPPAPTEEEINATIAGPDKNNNGIRDDVERAIFEKYPMKKITDYRLQMTDRAAERDENFKLRAASLQYAQSQQIFLTMVHDKKTMEAALERDSVAYACLDTTTPSLTPADVKNKENMAKAYDRIQKIFVERRDYILDSILNNDVRKKKFSEVHDNYMTSFGSLSRSCDI
jgi:hypothetical protein